jgi:ferric-dicitrate binding protein FerR (iron transport regulator)
MTERSRQYPGDDDVAKWVAELPEAAPSADFRERLRSAFIHGNIEESPRQERVRPGARRKLPWWRWVPAAAAGVAVVLFVVAMLNRGPAFRIVEVAGTGDVRVNDRPLAMSNRDALRAALHGGATLEVPPDGAVALLAPDLALYEVTGGTRMTLPKSPGKWFGRTVVCRIFVGEMRLKTGARFAGSQMLVYTPDGMVLVTGTLLSVQCDASGTCVCVVEGTAHVGVNAGDLEAVAPGYRKVMPRDGTPKITSVAPAHRDGLLDFEQRLGGAIKR